MSVEDMLPTIDAIFDDPGAIDGRMHELAATIEEVTAAYTRQSDQLASAEMLAEELQEQLGALSAANSDLETLLAEKNNALANAESELAALRQAYETRNQEYDLLNGHLTVTEEKSANVEDAKAAQDERIRAIAERVAVLLSAHDDSVQAAPTPEITEKAVELASEEAGEETSAAVITDPIDVLNAEIDQLALLIQRKAEAVQVSGTELEALKEQLEATLAEKTLLETNVTDAQNRAAGYQIEIANRSAELDALNEQIAAFSAAGDADQGERQRFAAILAELAQQVDADIEIASSEEAAPADALVIEAEVGEATAEAATEPIESEDEIARTAAVIAAKIAVLKEQLNGSLVEKTLLETNVTDAQNRAAGYQIEIANRSAELDALNEQFDMLSAVSAAAQDERQRFTAILADLAAQVGVTTAEEPAVLVDAAVADAETPAQPGAENGEAEDGVARTAALIAANVTAKIDALQEQLDAALAEKALLETNAADVQNRTSEYALEIANRSAELNALNERIAALSTESELALTERQRLTDALTGIAQQVGAITGEPAPSHAGDESAVDAETAGEGLMRSATVALESDDGISRTTAGVAGLVALFNNTRDALDDAQNQVAALEEQLGALTAAKTDLEATMSEKENVVHDLETAVAELQEKLTTKSAEFDALTQQVADLETQLAESAQSRSDMEAQLAAAQEAKGALEAQLETLNSELTSAQQRLGELDQSIRDLSAIFESDAADVDTVDTEIAGSRVGDVVPLAAAGGAATLAVAARRKNAALQQAQAEAETLRQQLAETEQLKAELEVHKAELETSKAVLEASKDDLETQLSTAQETLQSLQAQVESDAQVKAELEAQIETLNGELATTRQQLDELDQGLNALSAALEQEDDTADETAGQRLALVGVAAGGTAAVVAAARQKKAALRAAQAEAETLRQQLAETEQANAKLEQSKSELEQSRDELQAQLASAGQEQQAMQAQLSELQQAKVDLESQIETQNAELLALQRQTDALDTTLNEFSAAIDSGDEESVERAAQRLATPGIAAAGSAAVITATRRRNARIKQTEAEMAEIRSQFQTLIDSKADLSASIASQTAEIERLNGELAAVADTRAALEAQLADRSDEVTDLHARFDALQAQLAQTTEEVQSTRTELQLRGAELEQVQTQFAATTAWQQRAPAVVELGQSLALMADAKLSAANSAVAVRALPQMVSAPQDLTEIKGIGRVFEQRLYEAGVGTFWELATMGDDDLKQVLHLNELQLLHMDLDAIRADARRLAEESGTVGQIWDGEAPDDFEPIDGIGKIFEQRLYDAGIRKYSDLTAKTAGELAEIVKPKPPAQPDFEGWIAQARQLMEEAEGEAPAL